MPQETVPKAFLSYSWDDNAHKTWVRSLASRLRQDGVQTILDQWHAAPGDQLPNFMEQAVRENDFVLIICTPKYKARFDGRDGGAGYEGDVIQGEIFVKRNHRKFIPILRRGKWEDVAPSALLGAYYVDLRDGNSYDDQYRELIYTLHGRRSEPPKVAQSTPQTETRKRWTITLDGVCDESVKLRAEAIAKHLQELLGDSMLRIQKIEDSQ
jgi:hypothetical protein